MNHEMISFMSNKSSNDRFKTYDNHNVAQQLVKAYNVIPFHVVQFRARVFCCFEEKKTFIVVSFSFASKYHYSKNIRKQYSFNMSQMLSFCYLFSERGSKIITEYSSNSESERIRDKKQVKHGIKY